MTAFRCCTLTGVDETTDIAGLVSLSKRFPSVEWGVLWSSNQQEKNQGVGRYPGAQWVDEFIRETQGKKLRKALHICGKDALDFLRGNESLWEVAKHFNRVQLNVQAKGDKLAEDLSAQEVSKIAHMFTFSYGHGRIVFQMNDSNKEFCERVRSNGTDFLFDSSLGRGMSPASWPLAREHHGMRVGYAGGLGLENIEEQFPLIEQASGCKGFWIDMENKLRKDDRFNLQTCEEILQTVHRLVLNAQVQAGECADKDPELGFSTNPAELTGVGLDWWAGLAEGYAMNPPEEDSCRATYFDRHRGEHSGYSPTESANDLHGLLEEYNVGCVWRSGQWLGVTEDGEEIQGSSRDDAMMRAVIIQAFGSELPQNPSMHPEFMARWAGQELADEFLERTGKSPRP